MQPFFFILPPLRRRLAGIGTTPRFIIFGILLALLPSMERSGTLPIG